MSKKRGLRSACDGHVCRNAFLVHKKNKAYSEKKITKYAVFSFSKVKQETEKLNICPHTF